MTVFRRMTTARHAVCAVISVPAVSYTHRDVYKRQGLLFTMKFIEIVGSEIVWKGRASGASGEQIRCVEETAITELRLPNGK